MALFAAKPKVIKGAPTLAEPVSQMCTMSQFSEFAYDFWCAEIKEMPRTHRKQWEFCYILQALSRAGMLSPGRTGLGFGVGEEPLMAVMARYGAKVLGSDLDPELAHVAGWTNDLGYAADLTRWNKRGICAPDRFGEQVSLARIDMNQISDKYVDYDFCWSACSLEHLGSIDKGLDFIWNSLKTLKPGGLAVHTTEFNIGSNDATLEDGGTVLFRRKDLEKLAHRLTRDGHQVDFNFDTGDQPEDFHIDIPPYSPDNHLKLKLAEFVTTSIGILVRKAG